MERRKNYFKDGHRPRFHYTSQTHVINDPNGLLFYEGEYHLMHQYNVHNHIHWGHAVSKDLLHWEHLNPALSPDFVGQIWSGSAVVDWNNTSGLQTGNDPVFVALFTYNEHVDSQQSQGLAYSNDRGRSWEKYSFNPVLTPNGKKDFRDPKVFRYEEDGCWIMLLACGDHVEFYRSDHLTDWKFSGEFGRDEGAKKGIWECPDLFCLPVNGDKEKIRWVLTVSVNEGAPAGGTGMQYFVGTFDGRSFHNDNANDTVLWVDYGQDFYAGVTWNEVPREDGRRLMIGWADNWLYRDVLPTKLFRGQFSVVRELQLREEDGKTRLCQTPVRELASIYGNSERMRNSLLESGEVRKFKIHSEAFRLWAGLHSDTKEGRVEIRLVSDAHEFAAVGYDFSRRKLYIDRTRVSNGIHPELNGIQEAPLEFTDGNLELDLLADTSQIEVFANGGSVVMTDLIFPPTTGYHVEIHALESSITLSEGKMTELNTIWEEDRMSLPQFSEIANGTWADIICGLEGNSDGSGYLLTREFFDEFSLEVKIKLRQYRKERCAGIVFGYDETGNFFSVKLDAGSGKIGLYECDVSGREILLTEKDCNINVERVYRLCVEEKRDVIVAALDGVKIMEFGDGRYRGGRLGLYVKDSEAQFYDAVIGKRKKAADDEK